MIKLKGMVIKNIKYLGSDRILTVFTKELGKVTIMAKRVASSKSKSGSAVSTFTISEFICYPGKKFYSLSSAEYIKGFYNIGSDLERVVYANYAAELIDIFYEDKMEDLRAYNLLVYTINLIASEKVENTPFITLAFMLKLLGINGNAPNLSQCLSCEDKSGEKYYFDFSSGGILCENCKETYEKHYELNNKHLSLLNDLLYIDIKKLKDKNFGGYNKAFIGYLIQVINDYIVYMLGRKAKSFEFLVDMALS